MIVLANVTAVLARPVNAIGFVTQNFIHLNDGPATPTGFSIPVPAGNTGLTVVYYTKLDVKSYEKYAVYVDGGNGVLGGLNSHDTNNRGIFASFLVNGAAVGYGPRYLYSYPSWVQVVLGTVNNTAPRIAGTLYFNLYAGSTSTSDGLVGMDVAGLGIYQRGLTAAELGGVLPPGDADQYYSFAGYQPGDTVLVEQKGTGLDGAYIR